MSCLQSSKLGTEVADEPMATAMAAALTFYFELHLFKTPGLNIPSMCIF